MGRSGTLLRRLLTSFRKHAATAPLCPGCEARILVVLRRRRKHHKACLTGRAVVAFPALTAGERWIVGGVDHLAHGRRGTKNGMTLPQARRQAATTVWNLRTHGACSKAS